MKQKMIIVGAGLSGLYAAKTFQEHYDITVLEARTRIGGRVTGYRGVDLGPSWVWSHQKKLLNLIQHYRLELISGEEQGIARYDDPKGVQSFNPPPQAPCARVIGGFSALIEALRYELECPVILETPVTHIEKQTRGFSVKSAQKSYQANVVLIAFPPRLVAELNFNPPLPSAELKQFQTLPTWMAHTAKVLFYFKIPFWRQQGLSGFAFSNIGPMSEIHDISTPDTFVLFGFLHHHAALDEAALLAQLFRIFGPEAEAAFIEIKSVDWRVEPYTAAQLDAKALHSHPNYGLKQQSERAGLYLIGTETAHREGGYLEGALESVDEIKSLLIDSNR